MGPSRVVYRVTLLIPMHDVDIIIKTNLNILQTFPLYIFKNTPLNTDYIII